VDLRDPWSLQERLLEPKASPLYFYIERWYERKSLASAALVVSNTAPATAALSRAYPRAPGRFLTVLNGYDEDPVPDCPPRSRFVIAYAGSIYYDRNPRLLFRAVSRVASTQSLTSADIGLHFVGNVERFDGVSLADMAREEGVEHLLTLQSRLPRQELFRVLEGASILVSLPQDSHMAIPSKIYEYMTFHATLLVMAEPGSATAQLLAGSGADVVAPHDLGTMAGVIARRYEEFREGEVPSPLATDRSFSRAEQARILLDAIEDVVTGDPALARLPSPAASS
jgi:glycosyltransferase involved in cell wall biosynthesis